MDFIITLNLQQIEYLLELNKQRNYKEAAKRLFITQPALTIQIKNLEEELGVKIFDRTKKPIIPTEIGKELIEQSRVILKEIHRLKDLVSQSQRELKGNLRIGIIPTVAPYLVPFFINKFTKTYSDIQLEIREIVTEDILSALKETEIDAGIIVTPFDVNGMRKYPLFYEYLFAYTSTSHPLFTRKKISSKDISLDEVWLLKEGNCFRNQVINICSARKRKTSTKDFYYESHSIDSLMKIVDIREGLTIIPELALGNLSKEKNKMVKQFEDFFPQREVSLIVQRNQLKKNMIDALKLTIMETIPSKMLKQKGDLVSTKA